MRPLLIAVLIFVACGKQGAEKTPTIEFIDQVAKEVREKPRLQLLVKLAAESPSAEETAMLRSLEDTIEREGVGRITASGTQPGFVFVTVEVESSAEGMSRLRQIALDAGLLKRSSFRVVADD